MKLLPKKIVTTKSKIFFLPVFNNVLPINYFGLLANTYLWYDDYKDESFCLLYKFDGKVRSTGKRRVGFTVYEDNVLFRHELFEGYQDYEGFVIYKYRLTDELLDFRNLLIESRYSRFPENIKQIIINFNSHYLSQADGEFVSRILYRDEDMVQELADKWDVNPEIIPEVMKSVDPQKELFSNILKREDEEISEISGEDKR